MSCTRLSLTVGVVRLTVACLSSIGLMAVWCGAHIGLVGLYDTACLITICTRHDCVRRRVIKRFGFESRCNKGISRIYSLLSVQGMIVDFLASRSIRRTISNSTYRKVKITERSWKRTNMLLYVVVCTSLY